MKSKKTAFLDINTQHDFAALDEMARAGVRFVTVAGIMTELS